MRHRICEIPGIEKPVIQGPMVWPTDVKLAAAVSNAGGLGRLGPNAGQTVVTRDPDQTAENMRTETRKVRKLTDKPFSIIVLPVQNGKDIYTPPMLKVIYGEKVPVVIVHPHVAASSVLNLDAVAGQSSYHETSSQVSFLSAIRMASSQEVAMTRA